MKSIIIIFYVISFLIVIGVYKMGMTFGHGLGDAILLLFLIALNGFVFLLHFIKKRFFPKSFFLSVSIILVVILTIIYYLLRLTIWRGGEQPWNGELFI